jgi:hypothetical protein
MIVLPIDALSRFLSFCLLEGFSYHCPCDHLPGFDGLLIEGAVVDNVDLLSDLSSSFSAGPQKDLDKPSFPLLVKVPPKPFQIAEVLPAYTI